MNNKGTTSRNENDDMTQKVSRRDAESQSFYSSKIILTASLRETPTNNNNSVSSYTLFH